MKDADHLSRASPPRRTPGRPSPAVVVIWFVVLFVGLGLLHVAQMTQITALRYRIEQLVTKRQVVERHIAQLVVEIAQSESLQDIYERARRLGLVDNVDYDFVPMIDAPLPTE